MVHRNAVPALAAFATMLLSATIISTAKSQLPGAPQQRVDINIANMAFNEAGEDANGLSTFTLPVPVNSGFLVMTEDNTSNAAANWSDVVYFHNITAGANVTGQLMWISVDDGTGFDDADLAPFGIGGLTVNQVIGAASTQYAAEMPLLTGGVGSIYAPPNLTLPTGPPGTVRFLSYTLVSDNTPEPGALELALACGVPVCGLILRRRRAR